MKRRRREFALILRMRRTIKWTSGGALSDGSSVTEQFISIL
jgi:hypothetical protein